MLTDRLINEMGLLKLQVKASSTLPTLEQTTEHEPASCSTIAVKEAPATEPQQPAKAVVQNSMEAVKLDKDEFRLLVKMLQAIGHECTYDHISCDGQTVTYQHPKKTLVFNDICLPDTSQTINLSSLADLLSNPNSKRAVWEKLKTL